MRRHLQALTAGAVDIMNAMALQWKGCPAAAKEKEMSHAMQNLGQTEASTGTETASLDHHPHNPAFSQGLAGSVSLLTDSVTNAYRRIY